jgi:hypothetical protein
MAPPSGSGPPSGTGPQLSRSMLTDPRLLSFVEQEQFGFCAGPFLAQRAMEMIVPEKDARSRSQKLAPQSPRCLQMQKRPALGR